MRKIGSLSVLLIICMAGLPVSADNSQGSDISETSSAFHFSQFACTDCLSSSESSDRSESGSMWGDLGGRRERNYLERRNKAKEKRIRRIKTIVPLPKIVSKTWEMEKKDYIELLGSKAYDKTFGRIGRYWKSKKKKYDELKKSRTNFVVKLLLLWHEGAQEGIEALGDQDDDGSNLDSFWNKVFGEGAEGDKLEEEAIDDYEKEIEGIYNQ